MKTQKMYESTDQMIVLISDKYNILQSLGRFGISLGFGDKTVGEVCRDQGVDTYTFLAMVNFTINGYRDLEDIGRLSVPTLLHYLCSSHEYFIDFQLPFIRKELTEALDKHQSTTSLILKLYDDYSHSIIRHMRYEEKMVFPYVQSLLEGKPMRFFDIERYSLKHENIDSKLRELKNIIIKYLPDNGKQNNLLMAALHDIFNNEEWLKQHADIEDHIFIPAIRHLEKKVRQDDVSTKISNMLGKNNRETEELSEREKEVIVCLVQGMTNKEIADNLFISVNTVITHRRNIARKLQIHSPAGLTIYAIVNNLIDISAIE